MEIKAGHYYLYGGGGVVKVTKVLPGANNPSYLKVTGDAWGIYHDPGANPKVTNEDIYYPNLRREVTEQDWKDAKVKAIAHCRNEEQSRHERRLREIARYERM